MIWAAFITGSCGTILCCFYPTVVDSFLKNFIKRTYSLLKSLLEAPPHPEDDLYIASSLISYLRSGVSLDAALEMLAEDAKPASPLRGRLRRILSGKPDSDFLSTFLGSSLESGAPALAALCGMERALQCRRRLHLKARGITGQCRAQAEVLSWLPWLLALAIVLVDYSWFLAAAKSSLTWALWAIAVVLSGLGRQWIRRSIRLSLAPGSEIERFEEEVLPDFVLKILAEISQGRDVEAAADNSLRSLGNKEFREHYLNLLGGRGGLARLRSLLLQASRTGAPVREDLLSFLMDQQAETESRWEERVQRLPVALLAPLFACFFPASMMVIGGLLLPLLLEVW